MNLEEFVKQTLLDITNGVSDAQDDSKLYIAPGLVEGGKITEPQFVNFEVHVTTSKEGGGGIKLWTFGEVKGGAASESGHKISFQVPVFFQAPTERNERHFSRKNEQTTGTGGFAETPFGPKIAQQKVPDGEI